MFRVLTAAWEAAEDILGILDKPEAENIKTSVFSALSSLTEDLHQCNKSILNLFPAMFFFLLVANYGIIGITHNHPA